MSGILPGKWMSRSQQRWDTGLKVAAIFVVAALMALGAWVWPKVSPYQVVRICYIQTIEGLTVLETSDGRNLVLADQIRVKDQVGSSASLRGVVLGGVYALQLTVNPLDRRVTAIAPDTSRVKRQCPQ